MNEERLIAANLALRELKQQLKEYSEDNAPVLERFHQLQGEVDTQTQEVKDCIKEVFVDPSRFPDRKKTVEWEGWTIVRKAKTVEFPKARTELFLEDLFRAGLISNPSLKQVTEAIGRGNLRAEVLDGYEARPEEFTLAVSAPKE